MAHDLLCASGGSVGRGTARQLNQQELNRLQAAPVNPDCPWRLARMRVPAGETNSFLGGTDGSNPPSSTGESGANLIFGDEPHRGGCQEGQLPQLFRIP